MWFTIRRGFDFVIERDEIKVLYGEQYIDRNKLKQWVSEWDFDKVVRFIEEDEKSSNGKNVSIDISKIMVNVVKEIANKNSYEGDYYDFLMKNINSPLMNIYFKYDNSSVKIANFYEVLLKATDLNTEKKLIKGFEFEPKEFGEVEIKNNGIKIGSIGNKSDLIWRVFYSDFVDEDENGQISHTHNHDKYVTLQLWNVYEMDTNKLSNYVEQILFNCSVQLGLNFKKIEIDKLYKERGKSNTYSLDFEYANIEDIPLLYFNSTIQDTSIRVKFLSYYQVIEYFYIRANNILFRDEFINQKLHENINYNSNKLTALMKKYKKNLNEREAINLVLKKVIDVTKFKAWISQKLKRLELYTNNQDENLKKFNINLAANDNKIINKLGNRIYSIRCSIVHSKADSNEVKYIPNFNEINIKQELPLMKYVAIRVLQTLGMDEVI